MMHLSNIALLSSLLVTTPWSGPASLGQEPEGTRNPLQVMAGASPDFHEAVAAVKAAINAKDFATAKKLIERLPKRSVRVKFDSSKVPAPLRESFDKARGYAFSEWESTLESMKFELSNQDPDVVINFESKLAPAPEDGLPLGLAIFRSPTKPFIEAVIGLNKGKVNVPTAGSEVHNEVLYTLGTYLGIQPNVNYGSAMGRTNQPSNFMTLIAPRERNVATANLNLVDELRKAIQKKESVPDGVAGLYLESKTASAGEAIQGQVVSVKIPIANNGTAPLEILSAGDCACISSKAPRFLKPTETGFITATYDTAEIYGNIRHNVDVYTNDPNRPAFKIPVSIKVVPRYRFLNPNGNVVVVGKKAKPISLFFIPRPGETWYPLQPILVGIQGKVEMNPWEGNLADPEFSEPSKPRKGYKITVTPQSGSVPLGRYGVSVMVPTSSNAVPRIAANFYVQSGIVCQPDQVYLSKPPGVSEKASFLVSRPGEPFKILGIRTTSKHLTATYKMKPTGGEATVTLVYDGKSAGGTMNAEVVIKTDDKAQPELRVIVNAGM